MCFLFFFDKYTGREQTEWCPSPAEILCWSWHSFWLDFNEPELAHTDLPKNASCLLFLGDERKSLPKNLLFICHLIGKDIPALDTLCMPACFGSFALQRENKPKKLWNVYLSSAKLMENICFLCPLSLPTLFLPYSNKKNMKNILTVITVHTIKSDTTHQLPRKWQERKTEWFLQLNVSLRRVCNWGCPPLTLFNRTDTSWEYPFLLLAL